MKSVTNTSIQSFEIYFSTPKGPEVYWLVPHETVVVPSGYISEQIQTLMKRRHVRVQNAV